MARSPLAGNSSLVQPLLVLDDVSPTADEQADATPLAAMGGGAVGAGRNACPRSRPYDDPTWRDPHWWRYNILRHRYLEPLHPMSLLMVAFTETLR
ncbi:MAG: hypothetical protein R2932_52070 [Caldilineaceae bacterium]